RAEHALEKTEKNDLLDGRGGAAKHGSDGEADNGGGEEVTPAETRGEEAGCRREDRGGDDVGSENPGDRFLGCGECALHVGQGDIRDGRVERLHDRREHDGARDDQSLQGGVHDAGPLPVLACWTGAASDAVSTSTSQLMPERMSGSPSCLSIAMRTGMRCTTLTQL